jgi:hypothetical protein
MMLNFMKILLSFLLFAVSHYCLAQTDTNLIGAGDWSVPVSDGKGWQAFTLRGRLLLYDDHAEGAGNHARVYLELQQILNPTKTLNPVEIYYNPNMGFDNEPPGLLLGLRDARGQEIPEGPNAINRMFNGAFNKPYWITLPDDSTVRIRADYFGAGYNETNGLNILGRPHSWTIPRHATNDFYLHGTFISTNSHPSPLNYHIWQGKLELPPVKIPAKK